VATFTQQLVLQLLIESNDLRRGLKEVEQSTKDAEKQLAGFREAAGKALSFAGFVGGSVAVGALLKKSINAYGEYVNQVQTANQVFGESFGIIEEGIKDSVQAVGLSSSQYLQATTYIAGLGKAAGLSGDSVATFSQEIVKLGADLAAAFNTSTEQAIGAIQSGFSGSSVEPLRRYNIVINDTALKQEYFALTGEKVSQVLTQQQRAAAFISLLYQKSADYQGQWNRESDQFLGTQQRLRATLENTAISIGKSFEPAVTGAMNAMIDVLGPVTEFNDAMGGIPAIVAVGGAAMLALSPAFRAISIAAQGAAANLAYVSAEIGSLAATRGVTRTKAAYEVLSSSISTIGPGAFIAAAGITAFGVSSAVAAKEAEKVDKAIKDLGTGSAEEQLKSLGVVLEDLFRNADSNYDFSEIWKGTIRDVKDVKGAFEDLADSNLRLATTLLVAAQQGGAASEMFGEYGLSVEDMQAIISAAKSDNEQYAAVQEQVNTILGEGVGITERAQEAWDTFSGTLGDIAKDAETAKERIEDLIDITSEKPGDALKVESERLKVQQAIAEWAALYNSELEKGETQLDRDIAVLDAGAAIWDQLASAAETYVSALENSTGTELVGQDRIDALTNFYEQAKADNPLIAQGIDDIIANLQGIEVQILANDEDARQKIQDLLAGDGSARQIILDLLIDSGAAEEDAESLIRRLPDEKILKVVADAADAALEVGKLDDEEYVANLVVDAILDEAEVDVDDFTGREYGLAIEAEADLERIRTDIDSFRRGQQRTPIKIPVVAGGGATGGGGTEDPQGRSLQAVTAQQPINYINVRTGETDPSASVRQIQKWTRRNGALPIGRGR
jgi:hypothetical protein